MKTHFTALLPLSFALVAISCSEEPLAQAPLTPQQMYERAARLLKPATELESPDYAGAFALLTQAADAGYLPAILDLAGVYLEGSRDGAVKKDRQKALQLYSLAAERGSADAQYYCGFILMQDKKTDAAIPYLHQAAQAGVPEAQYRLGRILLQQSNPDALPLLRMAATSKRASVVAVAAYTMGTIFQDGKLGQSASMPQAIEWYQRSAEAGDPRAQHLIGLMYLVGGDLSQDEKKGEALLRLAAGQDYIPAIDALIRYLFEKDADAYADEIRAWADLLKKLQNKQ